MSVISVKRRTVEPPVSDHTKCKDLVVVTCGRWSLTRIEPQGVSSEKRSGHVYFMEDNLLHAISKLRHVTKFLCTCRIPVILSSLVHTANIEIRECVKRSLTRA